MEVGDRNLTRPVHFAAYYGATECLRLLLEHGATADAVDKAGRTPLHWACGYVSSELYE